MYNNRIRQISFVGMDLLYFYVSLYIALSLRAGSIVSSAVFEAHASIFLFVFLLGVTTNFITGLYDGYGVSHYLQSTLRFIESAIITFFGAALFFYITTNLLTISPKTILLLTVVIAYTLSFLSRTLIKSILHGEKNKTPIAIVGYNEEIKSLLPLLDEHIDLKVTTIVTRETVPNMHTVPHIQDIDFHTTQYIYITTEAIKDRQTQQFIYSNLLGKVGVSSFSVLYERITGKIPVSLCSEEWFIENMSTPSAGYRHFRTLLDYVSGLILGTITAILFPFIALAIKITSKGPIFFSQTRIGQHGKNFTLYKFRTMYALAPDGSAETSGAEFSKKGDTRITSIGKFLRKSRLDEFPQAWNLLKRDISLIGPRPERPEVVADLIADAPYFPVRTLVKPGITGWAAIKQQYTDNKASTIEKLQFDLYYIKHQSLILDVSIILRTISTMLHFRGQ